MNDTSLELGGSLGIAILGSLLSTSYGAHLTAATNGSKLQAGALSQAQDSVGAGYQVAQAIGEQAQKLAAQAGEAGGAGKAERAAELKAQADRLAQGAQQMADAVGSSFSDAVAHTSLIGAVVLGVGTVLVAFLLPGKSGDATGRTEATEAAEAGVEEPAPAPAPSAESPELTRTGR